MRTDIHKPSSIIPSDYEYVAIWTMNIQGFGDAQFMLAERQAVKAHMDRTGGKHSAHQHGGNCDVCGNVQAIYLVLYYHEKTNSYIRVGFDCSDKLGMSGDAKDFNLFRKNVQNAREAQAGKRKAIAILGDAGLAEAWDIYTAEYPKHAEGCKSLESGYADECTCTQKEAAKMWGQYEESTIRDIVGKLVKYGSVSEKQTAFIGRLLGKIQQRPILEAQRKAEYDAAGDAPVGRQTVTGEVLTVKEVENRFSRSRYDATSSKLLIKLENGSKVWGSRFANLERGNKITFTATFEASKDDAKFGFFKRPTVFLTAEQKKGLKILQRVSGHIWSNEERVGIYAVDELAGKFISGEFQKETVAA